MARRGRGRGRRMNGGSECAACTMGQMGQTGGKMSGLHPVSLGSSDSFDRAGPLLSRQAHDVYIQGSQKLASLNGQNAMMGGRRKKSQRRARGRGKGKSARKYSRKSRSKSARKN